MSRLIYLVRLYIELQTLFFIITFIVLADAVGSPLLEKWLYVEMLKNLQIFMIKIILLYYLQTKYNAFMKIKYVFAASFEIEYCFDKHGHLNILE